MTRLRRPWSRSLVLWLVLTSGFYAIEARNHRLKRQKPSSVNGAAGVTPTAAPQTEEHVSAGKVSTPALVIGIICGVLLCSLVVVLLAWFVKKYRNDKANRKESEKGQDHETDKSSGWKDEVKKISDLTRFDKTAYSQNESKNTEEANEASRASLNQDVDGDVSYQILSEPEGEKRSAALPGNVAEQSYPSFQIQQISKNTQISTTVPQDVTPLKNIGVHPSRSARPVPPPRTHRSSTSSYDTSETSSFFSDDPNRASMAWPAYVARTKLDQRLEIMDAHMAPSLNDTLSVTPCSVEMEENESNLDSIEPASETHNENVSSSNLTSESVNQISSEAMATVMSAPKDSGPSAAKSRDWRPNKTTFVKFEHQQMKSYQSHKLCAGGRKSSQLPTLARKRSQSESRIAVPKIKSSPSQTVNDQHCASSKIPQYSTPTNEQMGFSTPPSKPLSIRRQQSLEDGSRIPVSASRSKPPNLSITPLTHLKASPLSPQAFTCDLPQHKQTKSGIPKPLQQARSLTSLQSEPGVDKCNSCDNETSFVSDSESTAFATLLERDLDSLKISSLPSSVTEYRRALAEGMFLPTTDAFSDMVTVGASQTPSEEQTPSGISSRSMLKTVSAIPTFQQKVAGNASTHQKTSRLSFENTQNMKTDKVNSDSTQFASSLSSQQSPTQKPSSLLKPPSTRAHLYADKRKIPSETTGTGEMGTGTDKPVSPNPKPNLDQLIKSLEATLNAKRSPQTPETKTIQHHPASSSAIPQVNEGIDGEPMPTQLYDSDVEGSQTASLPTLGSTLTGSFTPTMRGLTSNYIATEPAISTEHQAATGEPNSFYGTVVTQTVDSKNDSLNTSKSKVLDKANSGQLAHMYGDIESKCQQASIETSCSSSLSVDFDKPIGDRRKVDSVFENTQSLPKTPPTMTSPGRMGAGGSGSGSMIPLKQRKFGTKQNVKKTC